MPSDLAAAARAYALRGWAVLPLHSIRDGRCSCGRDDCPSPGKHPRTRGGVKDATDNVETIREWWSTWPDAHVGVATGAPSGVWVLDVDDGADVNGSADLAAIEARHGRLPATLEARTGSGGRHLVFRATPATEALRNRARLKIDGRTTGLDVRATGGYVVVAPSGHESGGAYQWTRRMEPVEAPGWLLGLLTAPAPAPAPSPAPALPLASGGDRVARYLGRLVEDQVSRILGAPQGGRHQAIVQAAHKVGMYAGEFPPGGLETAKLSIVEAAEAVGKTRAEAERAVDDMVAIGQSHPKRVEWRTGRLDDDGALPDEDLPPPSAHYPSTSDRPPADLPPGYAEELDERRPRVVITLRQLREVVADAWRALHRANRRPEGPTVYRRGGALVEVQRTEQGPRIAPLSPSGLLSRLSEAADWIKLRRATAHEPSANGYIEIDADRPPQAVVDVMLSAPDDRLPVLEGLVLGPIVDSDGAIQAEPGYHPSARVLNVGERLALKEGPAPEAARLLLDHWLGDFPFASASDRAHALALVLTPFVRRLIAGPCPGFLVEAPTPGSGKSLLAELAGTVALGAAPTPTPFARQEEERRKALLSALSSGRPMVFLDNVSGAVADSTLEGILTAYPAWTDRDLGRIAELTVPALSVFALTSNNATLSTDMARRVCRVRLDPATDRPGERTGFKLPDVRRWTRDNRALLVSAALAIVRAWMDAGRPYDGPRLGSFERFSEVVGGCLQVAQVEGFLGDRDALFRESDREGSEWAEVVSALWAKWAGRPWGASDLLTIADEAGLLGAVLGDGADRARLTRLGAALRRMRDRVWSLDGVGRVRLGAGRVLHGKTVYVLQGLDRACSPEPEERVH